MMQWIRGTWVILAPIIGVGAVHITNAQIVELVPAVRFNNVIKDPLLGGWNLELGIADTSSMRLWIVVRYAEMNGETIYRDSFYRLHDQSRCVGLAGGIGWVGWKKYEFRLGMHADHVTMRRNLIGDPSSWIGTYQGDGIACGLSGRIRYSLGESISISLGTDPGYFFLLDQSTVHEPFIERRINGGPYWGFTIGAVFKLNAIWNEALESERSSPTDW